MHFRHISSIFIIISWQCETTFDWGKPGRGPLGPLSLGYALGYYVIKLNLLCFASFFSLISLIC